MFHRTPYLFVDSSDTSADLSGFRLRTCATFALPFRIRLSGFQRWDLGQHRELITYNEHAPGAGAGGAHPNISRQFSKAIVVAPLNVSIDVLSKMVGLPDASGASMVDMELWNNVIATAAHLVNVFLTTLCEAQESVNGIAPITHISPREVSALYRTIVVVATREFSQLRRELLIGLFSHKQLTMHLVNILSVGSDIDVDLRKMNLIATHLDSYSFYETSMRARCHAHADEHELALILMCVAFEAVHAAVVKRYMARRIPNDSDTLSETVIRDLGITSLLKITPYLVLKRARRPSVEALSRCEIAIRCRNAIVHSLVGRDGRPKKRSYSSEQLRLAYEDVRTIYQAYLEELHAASQQSSDLSAL